MPPATTITGIAEDLIFGCGQPPLDEIFNHCGFSKGAGIAQIGDIIGSDFAENPAHDLARPGFGQAGRPLNKVG